jgi:molybdenum cofactor cytidylyltransferase
MQDSDEYIIIILAAGSSSRYGSPKQLLSYKGKSLLRHSVDVAVETGCHSVIVILGANCEMMRNEVNDKPVIIVENPGWREGMASSIRCGVEKIMNGTFRPEGVIIMVCDQPNVSSSLLLKLVEKNKETEKPIVSCSYDDNFGTPALFHQSFFPALMKLTGDKGARKLISENQDKATTVPFPEGITNIDTVSDYELLKNCK